MALAMLMSLYGAFVGMMLYVFYLGAKSALFGLGYWLIGGRESFGWGARVAGALLMMPVLISIIFWIAVLASGHVTTAELGRGERWLGPILTAGISVCLCIAASYILGEVTYTPYFIFTREEGEEKEELSPKELEKRRKKLEMKREKRRQREEQKRLEREAEEQRQRERQQQAKTRTGPPPMPVDSENEEDDEEYYRRRRR